ncbi:ROK family transcriptional regulator [Veillonella magna]|uniref:ROK family transcriptional regulator n=1 Tax=Veillonella magna TaxID=464322 RepID=A0ABS2GFK6_9FIRM|nr:ROK family transcriptional regulator [Veillonella magna]MBM6824272.1 ROK family transcriptional regulator [Veillonella magna]MBM6912622.1 ROK family transcriptional regulator [Veillonella magna]
MPRQQLNNDEIILNYIRRNGPVSKASIARNTGITAPTVTNICNALMEKDLIYMDREERSPVGRPSMLLRFNEHTETMMVIHIRTYALLFYVVTAGGTILHRRQQSSIGMGRDEIMNSIYREVAVTLEDARFTISCLGLVMRGPVDSVKGISVYSPHAKWNNVPFKYMLEERFHLPVFLDNDVRCLSTGEYYYGSGKGIESLVVLKFSYGLGSALLYQGSLFRGFNESAGEIGHTIVPIDNGQRYTTLEEVASETAIRNYVLQQIKAGRPCAVADSPEVNRDAFRIEPIYEAAVKGDAVCLEALKRVGNYLGATLANISNLINPERIVLSSALGEAVTIMEPILRDMIEKHVYKSRPVDVVYSGNGVYYTLLGMVDIMGAERAATAWLV